jgi:hypothetical protein
VHLRFVISAESRVKEAAAILASYPDLLTMRSRWAKKTSEQMLTRDAFTRWRCLQILDDLRLLAALPGSWQAYCARYHRTGCG